MGSEERENGAPYFKQLPPPFTGSAETHNEQLYSVGRVMFEANGCEQKPHILRMISGLL
jgi:hypothetical protein